MLAAAATPTHGLTTANHRCYLWTEALSAKVFAPAQKLSGIVWTWPQANRTKTAARTSKQQHEQLIFWAKQLLCTCITILCTIFRRPLHDYEVKLLDVKLWRTWKHGEKISFLTLKLDTALKNYLRLTNWEKLNKGDLKEHKPRPLSIAHPCMQDVHKTYQWMNFTYYQRLPCLSTWCIYLLNIQPSYLPLLPDTLSEGKPRNCTCSRSLQESLSPSSSKTKQL